MRLRTKNNLGRLSQFSRSGHEAMRTDVRAMVCNARNHDVLSDGVNDEHG
jgi:hypothetical protein